MLKTYKQKARYVSAFQWKGKIEEIPENVVLDPKSDEKEKRKLLYKNWEGTKQTADYGDYIVRGFANEPYTVAGAVFEANFELQEKAQS
jgi:hypothetical protein